MAKQYGLIKPGNVFGDDSDDDNENSTKIQPKYSAQNSLQMKKIENSLKAAVAEDASIFMYDEVYDDIQNKRNEIKKEKKSQEAKKPKYINKLIETAEKRKKEYERRVERQVQKERIAEGEQFKDKESFVTSTYRKKLEEMKEAELQEKRQDYLESVGDVTKQSDLSGFYRHLYTQKLGNNDPKDDVHETTSSEQSIDKAQTVQKKKNYRKRENSNDDDEPNDNPEEKFIKREHIQSNIDADSDFSVDSSSEDSGNEKDTISKKQEPELNEPKPEEKPIIVESPKFEKDLESKVIVPETKPKIDIWTKRTVGEIFNEAVKRYYERKAMRIST